MRSVNFYHLEIKFHINHLFYQKYLTLFILKMKYFLIFNFFLFLLDIIINSIHLSVLVLKKKPRQDFSLSKT